MIQASNHSQISSTCALLLRNWLVVVFKKISPCTSAAFKSCGYEICRHSENMTASHVDMKDEDIPRI